MKIIAITGGKGGTGKSTVATSLAFNLAKTKKVLLVDCDADCPNDHLILNIKREKIKTVFQRIPIFDFNKCIKCGACSGVCNANAIVGIKNKYPVLLPSQCNGCGACFIKCPVGAIKWGKKEVGNIYRGKRFGIDLLSSELKINEPASVIVIDAVKEIIQKQKAKYDYVLIDTAAGLHCDVISALDESEFALVVSEATSLGGHDLELILKLLNILKIPKEIILNKSNIGDKNIIFNIAKKYKTKIICQIPYNKSAFGGNCYI